jgi:serine/threonine protein kinase
MADLKTASAVDVADLLLAAVAGCRSAALTVDPGDHAGTVRVAGTVNPASVALPPALAEALVVRLALLGNLDPWAIDPGIGRLRSRSGANVDDFLVELEGAAGVRRLRLRAVAPRVEPGTTGDIRPGAELVTSIGSYRLHAELGRGGMGVVYRAVHLESGRTLAIKVLHAELAADPRLGAQLGREGRAASLANHPGIVRVTDFGSSSTGRAFLVMELVEAETLEKLLLDGALPVRRALTLARRIVGALEAAHVRGVIHHDLKPSNVFVDPLDQLKIGDFGAARVLSPSGAELTQTQAGVIVGTPRYMAPERARGLQADERSDLYSVGCMLFQMISGRPPYDGDSLMDVLVGHVTAPIPKLESPYGAVPETVARVVIRSMAKKPEERYPSAGEMDTDLNRALQSLPTEGGP